MTSQLTELERTAARARRQVLRMVQAAGSGHLGGALSAIDIITVLYGRTLHRVPGNPEDQARDRFLLSAGHKAMAQYAVLAEYGYFPESVLDTHGQYRSRVPGHPNMHELPGVEANTGALGHGLPIGCGMALGARLLGLPSRVFVLLGDGELPEGSNWEGAAIAAHHRLDNLVAIVDVNGLQISGPTAEVMDSRSITGKFGAFGWATREIDGHDLAQIVEVLDQLPAEPGRPTAIIAHTIKAKGIKALEGQVASHYWTPEPEQLAQAIAELDAEVARTGGARVDCTV